jgi:cytochrome c nitrite reductase small subunit
MAVAPKEREDQDSKQKRRRRKTRGIAWVLATGVVLIGLAIWGMHATSQPNFCGNCHQIKPLVTSWASGPHQRVGCLDCHANPGTVGYVIRKVQGLGEVYHQVTNQIPAVLVAKVNTQNCIICHTGARNDYPQAKNIKLDTGPQAPKVSHKEMLNNQNVSCLTCHKYTGHPSLASSPTSPD